MFDGLCDALQREMEMLDKKYAIGNVQINTNDLDNIDKIAHALKSLATYDAMQGSSEYDGGSWNNSYARGRSRTTGRYISRDGGNSGYDPYYDRDQNRR